MRPYTHSQAPGHSTKLEMFSTSTGQSIRSNGEIARAQLENACCVQQMRTVSRVRALALAGLVCLPIFYLLCVLRWHPTNFFGLTQDDSIYFSSAKALTQGRGYILPSIPGTPAATKYPILYPLILSLVWRLNSSFPANLHDAIAVTAMFGLVFMVLAFTSLRTLGGLTDWEALLLTAFCAFHPVILYFSLSILSDIPFAALAIAALLVGDRAMRANGKGKTAAYCGILTGLSILMRMFGIAIAMGVIAAALARRAWRQAFIYCAFLAPFCAGALWRLIAPPKLSLPVSPAGLSTLGWRYTWTYYTSYVTAWRTGIPNAHIFWAMIKNNGASILAGPASYFLDPLLVKDTPLGRGFVIVVTAAILAGIFRQARHHGWRAIHYALPFYVAIMLFWNYPISNRFFLPFLPLFAAGLWFEGKHALMLIRATIFNTHSWTDKAVAVSLALLITIFGGGMAWNYLTGMRTKILEQSTDRAGLLEEKKGAYEWLSQNASPDAKVIAYEDANVYLYTGRVAMRPLVYTSADFYDPERLKTTSAHMTDVPVALRADYWLFSDDDYGIDWPDAFASAHARMAEIEGGLSLVYRSKTRRVRVYQLNCPQHTDPKFCQSAE